MLGFYGLSNLALNTLVRENLSVAAAVSGSATATAHTSLKLVFATVIAGPATASALATVIWRLGATAAATGTMTGALTDTLPMISSISGAALTTAMLGLKHSMASLVGSDVTSYARMTHVQNRTRVRGNPMSASLRMRS